MNFSVPELPHPAPVWKRVSPCPGQKNIGLQQFFWVARPAPSEKLNFVNWSKFLTWRVTPLPFFELFYFIRTWVIFWVSEFRSLSCQSCHTELQGSGMFQTRTGWPICWYSIFVRFCFWCFCFVLSRFLTQWLFECLSRYELSVFVSVGERFERSSLFVSRRWWSQLGNWHHTWVGSGITTKPAPGTGSTRTHKVARYRKSIQANIFVPEVEHKSHLGLFCVLVSSHTSIWKLGDQHQK